MTTFTQAIVRQQAGFASPEDFICSIRRTNKQYESVLNRVLLLKVLLFLSRPLYFPSSRIPLSHQRFVKFIKYLSPSRRAARSLSERARIHRSASSRRLASFHLKSRYVCLPFIIVRSEEREEMITRVRAIRSARPSEKRFPPPEAGKRTKLTRQSAATPIAPLASPRVRSLGIHKEEER